MKNPLRATAGVLVLATPAGAQDFRVLALTTTAGWHHASIPDAVAALGSLGARHCFAVEATDDPGAINSANLARFDVVVFLLTTGDILNAPQEAAFEAWYASGGGWVGVHSAADTEYGWAFYGQLLGAYFAGHPLPQTAAIRVSDPDHPSTAGLPDPWARFDEWYDFTQVPGGDARILLRLDESTYSGGQMGADHPIAWCREGAGGLGGRAWYTGGGHTSESYTEPYFRAHLLGGVLWAAGRGATGGCCYPDCTGDAALTVADFGCFQTRFAAADPYADCNQDGALTVGDFGCFQTEFIAGCP